MPLNADEAFDMLRNQTVEFLKRYPLKIKGIQDLTGHHHFYISEYDPGVVPRRPGSNLGTKSMHETQAFQIYREAKSAPPLYPVDEHRFFTIWVESAGYGQARFLQIPAPRAALLMTEMLTGCTFVVLPTYAGPGANVQINVPGGVINLANFHQPNGAPTGIQCAHVQCGNLGSDVLHDTLDQRFPQQTYGRRYYSRTTLDLDGNVSPGRTVAIVGVYNNNQWRVYAQKIRLDFDHFEVRSVYRIYPSPREKM